MDREELQRGKLRRKKFSKRPGAGSLPLRERMQEARLVSQVYTTE